MLMEAVSKDNPQSIAKTLGTHPGVVRMDMQNATITLAATMDLIAPFLSEE